MIMPGADPAICDQRLSVTSIRNMQVSANRIVCAKKVLDSLQNSSKAVDRCCTVNEHRVHREIGIDASHATKDEESKGEHERDAESHNRDEYSHDASGTSATQPARKSNKR